MSASVTIVASTPASCRAILNVIGGFLEPVLAQATIGAAVTKFLDFLAKVFLILGALIITYGVLLIHQGRVSEGLLGLLGGFNLALAIPLRKYLLTVAGVNA